MFIPVSLVHSSQSIVNMLQCFFTSGNTYMARNLSTSALASCSVWRTTDVYDVPQRRHNTGMLTPLVTLSITSKSTNI